ncbi:hypothetical protein DFJ77DRAFT_450637 [Powellomyces hirtus]|nr:hypothetical protein DFJ77DRAFT_450637 [Powellomyces hirtus]
MCCYGAYLTYYVFVREMKIQQVDKLWVINRDTGARTPIKWEQMWMYMVHREILLAALGLFCVCAGVVVFAFTLYQLSLIMRGVTTNEVFKWDDLKYDIKQGEVHIPRSVLERNQGLVPQEVDPEPTEKQQRKRKNAQRRSKASDSGRQRDSEQDELVLVEDAKQIRNIYHLGSWRNLMEMLFPTPL